ncbi:MAG: HAMP domain-containing histidine kinase [Bacteroidetes bacterium]|nr:HAMP domain-containing histidine kinase [Bacteroidota bacterium]
MNIYSKKQRWKWILLASAMLIVAGSLWYTSILVKKISRDEREKVQFWADAIQKKASLVKYTEEFFEKIKIEERKKVELFAGAMVRMINAENSEDLTFYANIISDNDNIPVILTDDTLRINTAVNVDFSTDSVKVLKGKLLKEFSTFKPIIVNLGGNSKNYVFYKESKLFTELRKVLNENIKSFIGEVVINSASVPVIITDSTKEKVKAFANLDSTKITDKAYLSQTILEMESQNKPIEVELVSYGKSYIFYHDSNLLIQLRNYPYFQFGIIGLFLLVAYFLFSTARKAEQNQVWVGMAKETAHQLGTPLSSLYAWIEILKLQEVDAETIKELGKDIKRLDVITQRFSNIGSLPKLKEENVVVVLYEAIEYLKSRTSKKVDFSINVPETSDIIVPLNIHLFEWVIENLCKNAVDAMAGVGSINIDIVDDITMIYIDISDTGKGITKSKFKTIFNPGYTSKQRGWGLGLTLAKRIIENYHDGKIFVKQSTLSKGTIFRIVLKK